MSSQTSTISWRNLFGNKFSKSLHPAMLSESGLVKTQRIKRVGDITPSIFNVIYDREYVVQFVSRKFCKALSGLDKEKLLELTSEAWDLYAKECLEPQAINRPID